MGNRARPRDVDVREIRLATDFEKPRDSATHIAVGVRIGRCGTIPARPRDWNEVFTYRPRRPSVKHSSAGQPSCSHIESLFQFLMKSTSFSPSTKPSPAVRGPTGAGSKLGAAMRHPDDWLDLSQLSLSSIAG